MTIKTYKYESPNNFINKTLTGETIYTGALGDESSVLDPVFEIETASNLANVNYCWIEEFNRYYYITNIVSVTDKLWRIYCHVDVLMTYKPIILGHEATIARQEELYNLYLNDGNTFKVSQKRRIQQKEFPNGFTDNSYVLILAGDVEPGVVPV